MKKNMQYEDYAPIWLKHHKEYVKESTYNNYNYMLIKHIIPILGAYNLKDINNELIQEFILLKHKDGRLNGTGGLALKTVKDIFIVLKQSIDYAMHNQYMESFHWKIKYPNEQNTLETFKVFNDNEMKQIINQLKKNLNLRNIGLLICIYTGIRIGEICALKWSNIDLIKQSITIDATLQRLYILEKGRTTTKIIITSPKSKKSNRMIPIPDFIIEILKLYEHDKNSFLLTNETDKYVEPRLYRYYYGSVLEQINVPYRTFHALRHTFATKCINEGADYKTVSEILGHSSVGITLDVYLNSDFTKKIKAIDLIKY